MRTRLSFACLWLTCMATAVFGQTSWRFEGDTAIVTMGPRNRFVQPTVTGAPYSAEQVYEHVQTLADGTHITQPQQNHEKQYRDSQGRTRTERSMNMGPMMSEKGEFVLTEIHDPSTNSDYVIDDVNKVAHRITLEARPARPATPRVELTDAQKAAMAKQRSENTTEQLGTQNIEGVDAIGTRNTRTIAIGEMGNDKPIVTTNEFWRSQELKLMVLSKTSDPRYGDNTTRLTNISRAEPDASLFMPPAGYAVVDEKDTFTITIKKQ